MYFLLTLSHSNIAAIRSVKSNKNLKSIHYQNTLVQLPIILRKIYDAVLQLGYFWIGRF